MTLISKRIVSSDNLQHCVFYLEKICVFIFLFSLMIPLSTPIGPAWSRIYFWDFSLITLYILWAAQVSFNDKRKIKITFLDGILMSLILWFYICDIVGPIPEKSLEACFLWVRGFFIYLYFSRNIGRVISAKSFLVTLLLLVSIEGFLSIIQQITKSNFAQINEYFGTATKGVAFKNTEFVRARGTFINPNILAAWMVILLPIILSWTFHENSNLLKKIIGGAWVLGVLSVVFSLSRSKLITFIIGLVIILYWNRDTFVMKNHFKNPRVLLLTITFISVLFVSTITAFPGVFSGIWHRFGNMEKNFKRKFIQMSYAIEIMKNNPFFGKGQGNYDYKLEENKLPYIQFKKNRLRQKLDHIEKQLAFYQQEIERSKTNIKRNNNLIKRQRKISNRYQKIFKLYNKERTVTCHNIPLKIGSESGIIGLIIFIIFCLYVFIKWLRVIRKEPSYHDLSAIYGGALTGIICIFFDMQWNTTMSHHSFLPLFFVVLGFSFSTEIRSQIHN